MRFPGGGIFRTIFSLRATCRVFETDRPMIAPVRSPGMARTGRRTSWPLLEDLPQPAPRPEKAPPTQRQPAPGAAVSGMAWAAWLWALWAVGVAAAYLGRLLAWAGVF